MVVGGGKGTEEEGKRLFSLCFCSLGCTSQALEGWLLSRHPGPFLAVPGALGKGPKDPQLDPALLGQWVSSPAMDLCEFAVEEENPH